MANVIGLITNEGLQKSIQAQANLGWKIYPRSFAMSDQLGPFETTRDLASMRPTWYNAPISSVVVQGPNSIEFICTIPPGVTVSNKYVREMYIIAKDELDNDFLLGLGQPNGDVVYTPEGSSSFRIIITISNLNLSELYRFNYTQATEIFEHNIDPNAHPLILAMFKGTANVVHISANYLAQVGQTIFVDTTLNPVTVTLPSTGLSLGHFVRIIDVGHAVTQTGHELYINRNTKKIDKQEEDFQIDSNGGDVRLTWNPTMASWLVDVGGRFFYSS